MSERIFLDASVWIALRHPRDEHFEVGRQIAAKVVQARARLVSTWFVAAEAHAALTRNKKARIQMLREMEKNPYLTLETVTTEDQRSAIDLLHANEDKSYSLCDAVSFVVMERLGIARVLTFDGHFSQIGRFQVIDHPDAF